MEKKPYYPEGTYRCRGTFQGFTEAGTGTPQFALQHTPLECLEPANDALEKYSRTVYWPITDGTKNWFLSDMQKLGYQGDDPITDLDPNNPGHFSFVGRELVLYCSHEDAQGGGMRERWGVRSVGKPLDKAKLHALKVCSRASPRMAV